MKKNEPSNLELQVLSVLWDRGPSSAREVLEAMPDKKNRAYTTVLSVLQTLEKKKLVNHKTKGNANIYSPKVEKRKVLRPILRNWVNNVFGGKPSEAMLYLLEETEVNENELKEIQQLVSNFEKEETEKA